MILGLLLAATSQQGDIIGSLLKPLLPLFILAVFLKFATSFIPRNQPRAQDPKKQERPARSINSNLIPCPDCNDLISPKATICPHCGAPIDANYVKAIKEKKDEIEKKRHQARKTAAMAKMIAMGILGLIFFIGAISSKDLPYRWVSINFGLLLIGLSIMGIYVFLNKSKIKGKMGELLIAARLRKGLPEGEYDILNNIYLPIDNGATAQIDHIVVSRFGVFIVESKTYSGWIFAEALSKVWTQIIYRKKCTFKNPIFQNYSHLCAISENLGIPKDYLRGIVAFTGDCEFKTPMPDGVVYSRHLADYIKSFSTPLLKEREKNEIVAALREWDATVTPEQRAAHVDNLQQRHR